jgi:SAM-dependent methyltransferase
MLAEARRQLGHLGRLGECAHVPVEVERAAPGGRGQQVQWVQGDALALGFTEAFDVVISFGAFGHIPQRAQPRFVSGIFQALRPGGLFACVSAPRPRPFSRRWLFGRGYNAVAHLRNWLVRPPFVMCYLTFTLEMARHLLTKAGFQVEVTRGCFPAPYEQAALVLARRPAGQVLPQRPPGQL